MGRGFFQVRSFLASLDGVSLSGYAEFNPCLLGWHAGHKIYIHTWLERLHLCPDGKSLHIIYHWPMWPGYQWLQRARDCGVSRWSQCYFFNWHSRLENRYAIIKITIFSKSCFPLVFFKHRTNRRVVDNPPTFFFHRPRTAGTTRLLGCRPVWGNLLHHWRGGGQLRWQCRFIVQPGRGVLGRRWSQCNSSTNG